MYPFCIEIDFSLSKSPFENPTGVPIIRCAYITMSPSCVRTRKVQTRQDKTSQDKTRRDKMR